MPTDKALELVGPIMDAYNAAEKAGASALGYALECGKQLSAAHKTVTAAKGTPLHKVRLRSATSDQAKVGRFTEVDRNAKPAQSIPASPAYLQPRANGPIKE